MTESVDAGSAKSRVTKWVPTGDFRTSGKPVFKEVKIASGVEIPDMDTLPPINPKTGKKVKQFLEPLPGFETPPKQDQS